MTEDITQLSYALDTFYFLVCAVLVMWMAAGFAMLEAGLVRAKNTAEILTKNVVLFAISCTMYLLFSYHLMYSSGAGGFLPSLGFLLGGENSVDQVLGSNGDIYYSNRADFFFQVVFVATAMSIVSGAVAERMKLWAFLAFAVVMTAIIYPTSGYWTWGGGWLAELGYSDYAGSGIVHMAGAAAALAGVIVLGPRKGKYGKNGAIYAIPGANLPLATLGTFILWMGWFGFNGGSELMVSNIDSANNMAQVLVNTNAAAAGGVIAALILAKIWFRKADLTMALNGAIAGLVAITADPLSPTGLGATLIGAVGGLLVVVSIVALDKLKIDDPVGAISAHGVAGLWGVLVVPVTNASASFGAQIIGAVAIFLWCFIASLIVWLILKSVMGVRVSEEEEYEGVDLAECGLEAYPEFSVGKK
ncbi:ammonium transporter [Chromohalobacter marismortui]|uniref:Ammonium transporter n=1 Tax=Chromohalobacter marismortui TaxID=42055 RepID=A0A4R7NDB7_9GAMM|nr:MULTISPECIES: ammonium transporter [Chromohalobacter]MCI0509899.1 ammonium transporter [Chromohalobacter sp.]MCI0591979.1 ammonium transporter [Chromohalobacter sp.]TDU18188.1 ammonium transporter [Chromohalobacter marismortui]